VELHLESLLIRRPTTSALSVFRIRILYHRADPRHRQRAPPSISLGASVSDLSTYEQPLNERIRAFLRLEHLFNAVGFFLPLPDIWGSRVTIDILVELAAVLARTDLKTEILKELERHTQKLARIRHQPDIDRHTLSQILDSLEQASRQVYGLEGQIGQKLRNNEFIKAVSQRSAIPAGTCTFDLPQFHHWLQQPAKLRQEQLHLWLRELQPAQSAITLLLRLTRGSSLPRDEVAEAGFFQQSLDSQTPAQLIRVSVPLHSPCYAEISGNKHRFTVRFIEPSATDRPSQTTRDIAFRLTCCIL
jgi:cell division protein ZapD